MGNLHGILAVNKYSEDAVKEFVQKLELWTKPQLTPQELAQTFRKTVELLELEAQKREAIAAPYTWDQFKDAAEQLSPATKWRKDPAAKPWFVINDCECEDPAECGCDYIQTPVEAWTPGIPFEVMFQRQEAVVPGLLWATWEVYFRINDERTTLKALVTQRTEPKTTGSGGGWSLIHNKATNRWEKDNG